MMPFTAGFTGTRMGMTKIQKKEFTEAIIKIWPNCFIHGGAEGADEQADEIVAEHIKDCRILIYPTSHRVKFWENKENRFIYPPKPPLVRNRLIIDHCNILIVISATENETLRSGTWSTVRYAAKNEKSIFIIFPSGKRLCDDN